MSRSKHDSEGQLECTWAAGSEYLRETGCGLAERSVRQVIHRVTRTITDWGLADGYFADRENAENFYRDLTWLCLHQCGAFNSPVWFNVGLFHQYGVQGAK